MNPSEREQKFQHGIELFNSERFFEAHEVWEEIWLQSSEPDRSYLQGIIQIAAAFHHYRRGNVRGARSLLDAGLKRLTTCPPAHWEIGIDQLRASALHWSRLLGTGGDPAASPMPQINRLKPLD
jgi:predicted metal-dependent hydrolase